MLDRHTERARLDDLLARIREGRSSTLLVDGGAGVGKTTLLQYLEANTHGMHVLSVTGIQSEVELAFAALHQLCRPLASAMAALPVPQREALEITFGQRQGPPPSALFVGLATLNLLSEASRSAPVLCIIDDAQWLDDASAQVLAFVSRRLAEEPVGMVLAMRTPSAGSVFDGVPPMAVEAFERGDAEALLVSLAPGPTDDRARDRVLDEARGNPLAIVESARALTRAELSIGMVLPASANPSRMEKYYQDLVSGLPRETQQLLLVAAADPSADSQIIFDAAAKLGIPADAIEPAVQAGLATAPVQFRHPLVRSAVYRGASQRALRAAHSALASGSAGGDPDLLAWHRARSVSGEDDEAALGLAAAAGRVHSRGGSAAAAALLHQAVDISSRNDRKAQWRLRAAQFELAAGEFDAAARDIAAAMSDELDAALFSEARLTEARIAFAKERGGASVDPLLTVAKELAATNLDSSREAYLEAFSAAMFGASLAHTDVGTVAQRWLRSGVAPGPRPAHALLDSMARVIVEAPSAMSEMQEALMPFRVEVVDEQTHIHWLWHATIAALAAWDFDTWEAVSRRHLLLSRNAGNYGELPIALTTRAYAHLFRGEFGAAVEAVHEISTIASLTGSHMAPTTAIGTAALRGRIDELDELVRSTIRDSTQHSGGSGLAIAYWGAAVMDNSRGNYEGALRSAREATLQSNPLHSATNWALVEAIEAASRLANEDASAELAQLRAATAGSSAWGRGVFERSAALQSVGSEAEAHYLEALSLLEGSPSRFDLARATLVYGEWLRRQRRQAEAREHLLRARQLFDAMGALAFADRASRELQAAGVSTRKRSDATVRGLTAQESQVAQLVAQGLTNNEVATRMFLSPRTVEHHLGKVYGKLGVSSRHQLAAIIGESPV